MSVDAFHGTWKIIDCVNISTARNAAPAQIDGAIFVLQDNGEIRWDLPPEVDAEFPLFQCDCYEVVHTFVGLCIQTGAVCGHMFEFWVDRPVPRDMMLLTFEGWCMIQCQQIVPIQPPLDFPFSFLPAFTEGYFSDMRLPNLDESLERGGKQLLVHSVILELSETKHEELERLPPEVLETVMFYLYSQSLPSTLAPETARRCISKAPKDMEEFVQMCRDYLHRVTLKQKIVKLVEEVHSCAEAMTSSFRENSVTNPSRFCYVIKQALRHAAVACMKLVELCVLYGEEAPNLLRNERLEILRYAKTRLPIFLTQFVALLRSIKNDFSTVRPSDRNDIAAHVAPEIETLLGTLSNLMREARDACNEIWCRWSAIHGGLLGEQPKNPSQTNPNPTQIASKEPENLTETLFSIFRKRETVKLYNVQGQIAAIFLYLVQKKENFEEMTEAVKIRCVSRNLEQLLEELPVFLLRIEEIMIAFDDRFQWKDFKFCLQLAISQVCRTVQHLRSEKERLQKFFTCLTDLVQRDEFHQSLVNLQLIVSPTSESSDSTSVNDCAGACSINSPETSSCASSSSSFSEGYFSYTPTYSPGSCSGSQKNKYVSFGMSGSHTSSGSDYENSSDLNLVENLCTPKKSKENILATNAVKLFNSKVHSDMAFEIEYEGEKQEFPAHRVIVASRCDWFRRALLSGMKESIQKRIVIHDCSSQVFLLFLRFIYTGQTGTDVSLEFLTDLIALADRYEVDTLKLYCEQELAVRHLDENSVIFLLSMADQFNARSLRAAAMEYIAANPEIMAKELFEELSPELQMEVYDITMWSRPSRKVFSTPEELLSCPSYMLVSDSPPSSNASSASTSPSFARRHPPQSHHSRQQQHGSRHTRYYGSSSQQPHSATGKMQSQSTSSTSPARPLLSPGLKSQQQPEHHCATQSLPENPISQSHEKTNSRANEGTARQTNGTATESGTSSSQSPSIESPHIQSHSHPSNAVAADEDDSQLQNGIQKVEDAKENAN